MNSTLDIRIRVRERLSPRLAGAFDGMTLVRCGGATDLVGEVADQTQLHGLLARIRDLGLELESVNVFAANPAAPAADGSSTCTGSPTPTSTPKQRQGAHP